MKRLIVDIDGTICNNTYGLYENAEPMLDRIELFNKLYDDGLEIVYMTARGSTTGRDWTLLTMEQLKKWGAKHHELIMNKKPFGDLYIDDRGVNIASFMLYYEEYIKAKTVERLAQVSTQCK